MLGLLGSKIVSTALVSPIAFGLLSVSYHVLFLGLPT